MLRFVALLFVCAGLLVGCRDDDPKPQPAVTPTETPAATASPTPAESPSPTQAGVMEVGSRVLLVEAATGKVTELFSSTTEFAFDAQFHGNLVEVRAGGKQLWFDWNGAPAGALPSPASRCAPSGGGVAIDGRAYPDVPKCGTFSPDGRYMLFEKDAGTFTHPSGYTVPVWDQWVLDTSNGAVMELQKGLLHCGGCDGRYGPRWSPTGRYVAYAELGGEFRRFLSNLDTGMTRQIGFGSDTGVAPIWSPGRDWIVYSNEAQPAGAATYEDLEAGTSGQLPIPWPVALDNSGGYLYSPAWGERKADAGTTTIIDATTLANVAELQGQPPDWLPWRGNGESVSFGTGGPVAGLQGAPGCEGTAVYHGPGTPQCVTGGQLGAVNSDGTFVAVAKFVGMTGRAKGPWGESMEMGRYGIDLVDVRTGSVKTVVPEVISWDYVPPRVSWNEAGTHFFVLAPAPTGL